MGDNISSKARNAFEDNISDAEVLLTYAKAFKNNRKRRMRTELRDRVGEALRIPARDRQKMDCLGSSELFMVFRDSDCLGPDGFRDLRPLLRPVIVAACAALETFVADRAMDFVAGCINAGEAPRRFRDLPLTVGRWVEIENNYERRKWGVRNLVEENIRELSSTAPNKIGEVLSIVGFKKWAVKVDNNRKVKSGTTVTQLEEMTSRRNKIAHSADRKGRGRANLDISEVSLLLQNIREIVHALDEELSKHSV